MSQELRELQELQSAIETQRSLPHLYGHKLYPWQREFRDSRDKIALLTCANQVGKSSINIKTIIAVATEPSLWAELWPEKCGNGETPGQMWYLYPDYKLASVEFEEKWEREFLPQGKMKDHPQYGWESKIRDGKIDYVRFNTGVTIYFKMYSQNPASLQAGTVYWIATDEELPVSLFDELSFRLSATDGYFRMVFTATLGQDEWRRCVQPEEEDEVFLPQARTWQISLYDCMKYEDGTPSFWTLDRIRSREARCSSPKEIERRIHGKFVLEDADTGLAYHSYNPEIHFIEAKTIPKDWHIYSCIDYGSGGVKLDHTKKVAKNSAHPSAFLFVAVSPDFTVAEVFDGRRLDGILTTAGDTVDYYIKHKQRNNITPLVQLYDPHCKDLATFATRAGESLRMANKAKDEGEDLAVTLFKLGALYIHATDELSKLNKELLTWKKGWDKRRKGDDLIDNLRYIVMEIPWDIEKIIAKQASHEIGEDKKQKKQLNEREEYYKLANQQVHDEYLQEFDDWNELY
jgi:hypothetical protein